MIDLLLAADVQGPEIDYEGLVAAVRARRRRRDRADGEPLPRRLRAAGAGAGAHPGRPRRGARADDLAVGARRPEPIVEGALAVDTLALGSGMLFYVAGIATVVLSLRAEAVRVAGAGEYFSLLLSSIAGMVVLASAENLVTLFVGLELLSIPLYALCAAELRRGTRSRPGSST